MLLSGLLPTALGFEGESCIATWVLGLQNFGERGASWGKDGSDRFALSVKLDRIRCDFPQAKMRRNRIE